MKFVRRNAWGFFSVACGLLAAFGAIATHDIYAALLSAVITIMGINEVFERNYGQYITKLERTVENFLIRFTVDVTEESGGWVAIVPGLPGATTYATHFNGLDDRVREAIALMLNLDDGDEALIRLNYRFVDGSEPPEEQEVEDARDLP